MLDIAFDFTKVTRDSIKNLVVKMLMNQINMDSVFNNLDLMETFIDESIPDFALLRIDIDFYETDEEFRSAIKKVQKYNQIRQEMEEHVVYNESMKKELDSCSNCKFYEKQTPSFGRCEKNLAIVNEGHPKCNYFEDVTQPELLGDDDDDDDEDFEEEGA